MNKTVPESARPGARLPQILILGAFFLSFTAGFINVVSFLGLFQWCGCTRDPYDGCHNPSRYLDRPDAP